MAYILIFVFALFDTLSTIGLVHFNLATEVNPVINFLLRKSPLWLFVVKMSLTTIIIGWLYRWRYRPKVRLLTKLTVGFYGSISALHCLTYIYYSGL